VAPKVAGSSPVAHPPSRGNCDVAMTLFVGHVTLRVTVRVDTGLCYENVSAVRALARVQRVNWKNRAKGWLQSYCKACSREYVRDHYQRNVAYNIDKAHARNLLYREDVRTRLLAFFRAHPCVDCGIDDPIVLQFDHEDPSRKSATVADLFKRGFSWRTIQTEMAKCQIRCANDHLRRTARQFGWYRLPPGQQQAPVAQLDRASGFEPEGFGGSSPSGRTA